MRRLALLGRLIDEAAARAYRRRGQQVIGVGRTGFIGWHRNYFVILRSARRARLEGRTQSLLVQTAAFGQAQFPGARLAGRREIARCLFRVHLDRGIVGHQILGDCDLLADRDALGGERLVLHVRHRYPAIDAVDAEPVEHVGHQLLEAHVLHPGDAFGAAEISVGAVAADLPLTRVVDEEFGDLAERAAFLAVVDDDPDPALLRGLDADLDTVHQIGPASADIGAEHVGAVAFVVHAAGDHRAGVADALDLAEQIDRLPADRRPEDFEVGAGGQL